MPNMVRHRISGPECLAGSVERAASAAQVRALMRGTSMVRSGREASPTAGGSGQRAKSIAASTLSPAALLMLHNPRPIAVANCSAISASIVSGSHRDRGINCTGLQLKRTAQERIDRRVVGYRGRRHHCRGEGHRESRRPVAQQCTLRRVSCTPSGLTMHCRGRAAKDF